MKLEYDSKNVHIKIDNMSDRAFYVYFVSFQFKHKIVSRIFDILCKLGLGGLDFTLSMGEKQ